ncbi:MAG: nucleolar RNA-binding Nop10p family protein [Candidatus Aenigmarchaeota archaeon]|nr:nucleolar RNA-binding Nop10p family protein [Candidatus Aenigmarchaeota archaeon]
MRRCESCETYTFKQSCAKCNRETINPNPPKYSPEDRYGKWRRMSMDEHGN